MSNFGYWSELACNKAMPCPISFFNFLWWGKGWNVQREMLTLVTPFLHRFYLENVFLDKFVRYNLTIYPVVITALTGSACKNFSFSSPTTNGIFIGESLGLFPTLVKDGQKTLPYLSYESRAEGQTCTWKVLFGRSRTRDFLEGFFVLQREEQKSWSTSFGAGFKFCVAPSSLPVQSVCPTILH